MACTYLGFVLRTTAIATRQCGGIWVCRRPATLVTAARFLGGGKGDGETKWSATEK